MAWPEIKEKPDTTNTYTLISFIYNFIGSITKIVK